MNENLLRGKIKELTSIGLSMEADLAIPIHRYMYKPIILKRGEITKINFETFVEESMIRNGIIEKSVSAVESFIKRKRKFSGINFSNSFESKICEYIGQIYLALYDGNEPLTNDIILEAFMISLRKSNLYDICTMIESGTYNGYHDYMQSGRSLK